MKTIRLFSLLLVMWAGSSAHADVMVLTHGYLSGAQTWDASGISAALEREGWRRAGVLVAGPAGIRNLNPGARSSGRSYYLVDLPSEAPVLLQADQLQAMLGYLAARHPDEPLILVGHSVGGIVARIALVRHSAPNAVALVTIATPHLGTPRAVQALNVSDVPFPLSVVTDVIGGSGYHTLRRSRGLYADLLPPAHGSLLGWLNLQPHPDIAYHSIVRGNGELLLGDELVPGFSQDMGNVPALRGRSTRSVIPASHALGPADAVALVSVLNRLPERSGKLALSEF